MVRLGLEVIPCTMSLAVNRAKRLRTCKEWIKLSRVRDVPINYNSLIISQESHNLLSGIPNDYGFVSLQLIKMIEAYIKMTPVYQNFLLMWT